MRRVIIFLFVVFCMPVADAVADANALVYGIPTLYGEYEISTDDVRRAMKLYGAVPYGRVRPIRASAPVVAAVKHPIKPKATIKKKSVKKSKKVQKKPAKAGVEVTVPVVVSTNDAPAAVVAVQEKTETVSVAAPQTNIPVAYATAIADSLTYRYDIESYCTRRGVAGSGNLPDGIILMHGRPDLMSCTVK